MDRSTLQRIVIVGGGTAGNHLKEEESKFFQVAGRLLSGAKKKQLARKYTREIVRMRRHYAAEYETVHPAKPKLDPTFQDVHVRLMGMRHRKTKPT